MNWNACHIYDTKEEMPGGAYWEFLEQNKEDIINQVNIHRLLLVIKEIKNQELKQQLKEKLKVFFDYDSLYEIQTCLMSKIFSEEEMQAIIKDVIEISKDNFQKGKILTKRKLPLDYYIINVVQLSKEPEWQRRYIKDILEFVNQNSYGYPQEVINEINTYLILNIRDKALRNEMVEKYSEKIWEEFKHYNEIIDDELYIKKKSKKYENVRIGLNPKLKIGLEIEVNRHLFRCLWLCNQKGFEKYNESIDLTVCDGLEIDTEIFHDIPEEISMICALCETLKEMGYKYDEESRNASGQINIGIDYLDTADSILNFFEIYCNCEELLFYISNQEGQISRKNIYENKHCKPFSGALGKNLIDEEITRDEVLRIFTANDDWTTIEHLEEEREKTVLTIPGLHIKKPSIASLPGLELKRNSVCLRNTNRLEFRIPNGTVDYTVWVDNIRLFGRIVEVAKEIDNALNCEWPTENEMKKIELKEDLKDETKTLEEKLFILMDLLFEDNEIKKIYMDRFYTLKKAIREKQIQEYTRPIGNESEGFGMVEFQKVYRTRVYENLGPVILYDPEEEIRKEQTR